MPAGSGTSSTTMRTATSVDSMWFGGSPSRFSPSSKNLRTPPRDALQRQLDQSTERRRHSRRYSPRQAIQSSPYSEQSEQLVRDFNQILLRTTDIFSQELDTAAAERAREHSEELARADREHTRIREYAEREAEIVRLREEEEQRKKEEEQRAELERIRQAKARLEAEARQRILEAKLKEEEAARKAAEQAKQLKEAEDRVKAHKERELAAQKQKAEKEEADRKAKEAAEKAKAEQLKAEQAKAAEIRAQQTQQAQPAQPVQPVEDAPRPTPAPSSAPVPASQSSTAPDEATHQKFLDLHKKLKDFRKWAVVEAKKVAVTEKLIGDSRRELRVRTGQITADRNASKATIAKIRDILTTAKTTGSLTVDVRPFIISQPIPQLANEAEAQYPAVLLYLLNTFSKAILNQFISEASKDDGKILQEIGLIAASIFADEQYFWKGISLVDVMLAKYHRTCPVLYGIYGNENTAAGRQRLGWLGIDGVPHQVNVHNQRMLGLSSGFAALTLRASKARPPIPMSEYWRAIANILNTPSGDLTSTHYIAMRGLIREYAAKFINFYGQAAIAVLRVAVAEFPKRAPPKADDAANMLAVLHDVWEKTVLLPL
ncbi:GLE1-domain-containing protein [Delitschia confertaspora ATCC 74209]|uniref:mRNA export factor GLE1 n=1 Tax=Delitschia confertaspora ATCC 74209 TaxID=1513339 RepID=A0A9P4MPE1_9PLEO|nr:GLE1-domain-containing protein [Delitschia confertaspora ATCC 74209]